MALNLEKIRQNAAKAKEESARRSANFFQFKEGRNNIRILPPWEGADDFSRIFGKHWNLGPEGKTMLYCPKVCFDKPCPICDGIDAMWKKKPDDAMKEWLKNVSSGPRFYANIIDLKDIDQGVQVAEFPKTVLEEIWNIMIDPEVGHGDITSLTAGRDLIIDKTGKGLSTRYSVRARLEATPVPIPISASDLPNLDMLVRNETYENLKLAWEGKEPIPSGPALPPPVSAEDVDMVKVGTAYVPPAAVLAEATPAAAPVIPAPVATTAPISAPVSPIPKTEAVPACFGNFNESNPICLDCKEQDDCEMKMIEIKRAARKATATTAPVATSTTPPAAATISPDALMAEMEKAINR